MSLTERRSTVQSRVTIIGGKAAPGYATAKTIIKMVNSIANIINNDPDVNDLYKVIFLPNYNVSQAMIIIPGADINQQISTAGMEASGTSNMKFVMNGSLIVGTLDGATVEIIEECEPDTVFLFGAKEHEVPKIRSLAKTGQYPIDPRLQDVFNWIRGGHLALGDSRAQKEFTDLINQIENNGDGYNGDYFLLCHDFPSFARAHEEADQLYQDSVAWTKRTIKAAIGMGKFSTDRTVTEYAKNVWGIEEAERPPNQSELVSLTDMTTSATTTVDENMSSGFSGTNDKMADQSSNSVTNTTATSSPHEPIRLHSTTHHKHHKDHHHKSFKHQHYESNEEVTHKTTSDGKQFKKHR